MSYDCSGLGSSMAFTHLVCVVLGAPGPAHAAKASVELEHNPIVLNRKMGWGFSKSVGSASLLEVIRGDDDAEVLFAGFA